MKSDEKHNLVIGHIHRKITYPPSGKLGVQEGNFILLERIAHQLSVQNELLEEMAKSKRRKLF